MNAGAQTAQDGPGSPENNAHIGWIAHGQKTDAAVRAFPDPFDYMRLVLDPPVNDGRILAGAGVPLCIRRCPDNWRQDIRIARRAR